ASRLLMQFQADVLNIPAIRPRIIEATARGSAFLAGLAVGFWKDQKDLENTFDVDKRFKPSMDKATRAKLYKGWQRAVESAKGWLVPGEEEE
ncbi:MAG: glycerol kinase, partial [Spirochaetia bacterium]